MLTPVSFFVKILSILARKREYLSKFLSCKSCNLSLARQVLQSKVLRLARCKTCAHYRHHTIYIYVVLFLVKMMAIVFYCTPTLNVFWILGLLTLRLQKVKIVKSMIIKNLQRLYNQYISWKYFEWVNLQSCSSNIHQL